jgi:hypothetical protein
MSQSFGDRLARRRETLHDNETPDPFDAAYRTTVNEAIHAAESGKPHEEIRDVLLAIDYVRPRVERFAADYFDLTTAQMHESGCRNAVDRLCDVLRDQTVRDQARKAINDQLVSTIELIADTYIRSAFVLGVSSGWLLSSLERDAFDSTADEDAG